MRIRPVLSSATVVALVLGGTVLVTSPAAAADMPFVDTLSDDTALGYTLRDAISDADSGLFPGPDVVRFDPALFPGGTPGTIALTSGLYARETLTIVGPGSGLLTITRDPLVPSTDYFLFQPYAADQDLAISGLTIDGDGTAVGYGLRVEPGTDAARNVTLSDVVMTDLAGLSTSGGVSIDTLTGTLLIEDSRFADNTSPAGPNGAALAVTSIPTVTIDDTDFDGNSSGGGGGALNIVDVGTFTFTRGSLTDNSTTGAGGAVIVSAVALTELRDVTVTGNRVTGPGGGIFFGDVTEVRIDGGTYDDNDATAAGGSLYFQANPATVSIADATFSNSDAGTDGGAIEFAATTATLSVARSRFADNSAASYGGAIHIEELDGATDIVDTTFTGNSAAYGGAIEVRDLLVAGALTVSGSTFSRNDASTFGASIYTTWVRGSVDLVDSTFDERDTSGVYAIILSETISGSTSTLRHSTVVGPGGLASGIAGGSIAVSHSIVESTSAELSIVIPSGSPTEVSWSLLSDAPGAGNVTPGAGVQMSTDPQLGPLQDNGGPTFTRLPMATSPVVNAGNPAVTGQPVFDQRGTGFARVVDGRIDLGAVERAAELAPTGSEPSWVAGLLALLALLAGTGATLAGRRRRAGVHAL